MTTTTKMSIVLEFSGKEAERLWALARGVDARQLLRDALGEFIGVRGGEPSGDSAEEEKLTLMLYVMGRYPHVSERKQRSKAREVCKRKALASLLRRAEVVLERSDEE